MTTRSAGVDSRCGEVDHPELGVVALLVQLRRPNGVTGLAWASTHTVSQNWDICSDYRLNELAKQEQAQEEYEAQRYLQWNRYSLATIKLQYKGTHLSAHLKNIGREDLLYLV